MATYTIEKGDVCRLAVNQAGWAKQEGDIAFTLRVHDTIDIKTRIDPKRLEHLRKLHIAMLAVPENELPKIVEIPD